ncbi:hypothetical protein GCM10023231_31480 [Olivibacter ginsenosidimutans]|uniref:RNA polymerase sigma-70 factor n=2 Tax=Olivibacter ginsenosidimutans TaxID=1176537 RepID=A0ABP9BWR9_9SPHI
MNAVYGYETYSDDELVLLLQQDDHGAYTEIYNRYSELLQKHALKKAVDFDDINDILQDIFTNLWLNRHRLDTTVQLGPYLYVAVRNRIFNVMSRQQVKNKSVEALQHFINENPELADKTTRERELAHLIDREIAELPSKMREIFVLSRQAHLSHLEIAEQLNISKQTVAKQVSNALKLLRVRLSKILFSFFFILIYLFLILGLLYR